MVLRRKRHRTRSWPMGEHEDRTATLERLARLADGTRDGPKGRRPGSRSPTNGDQLGPPGRPRPVPAPAFCRHRAPRPQTTGPSGPFATGCPWPSSSGWWCMRSWFAGARRPAHLRPTSMPGVARAHWPPQSPPPAFSEAGLGTIAPSLVMISHLGSGRRRCRWPRALGTGVVVTDDRRCPHGAPRRPRTRPRSPSPSADGSNLSPATRDPAARARHRRRLRPDQPPRATCRRPSSAIRTLCVGNEAFVVGNPFGLYGSMSAGVISGLGRHLPAPGQRRRPSPASSSSTPPSTPATRAARCSTATARWSASSPALVNPTEQNFFVGIGFAVPIDVAGGGRRPAAVLTPRRRAGWIKDRTQTCARRHTGPDGARALRSQEGHRRPGPSAGTA